MQKRELNIKIEEFPKTIYVKPFYIKKDPPKQIVDRFTPLFGKPGSIDRDGIYIPKNIHTIKKREIKSEIGKIHIPPRRSLFSGKQFLSKKSLERSDSIYCEMCSDPSRMERIIKMQEASVNIPPKRRKAISRYLRFTRFIGRVYGPGGMHHENKTPGYLAIDGIVKIKKVIKPRENALEETVPQTGVIRGNI